METDFDLAPRAFARFLRSSLIALTTISLLSSGCAVVGSRNQWHPPEPYAANVLFGSADPCLTGAETQYVAGQQAEAACNPVSIDHFLAAATQAWPQHVAGATCEENRANELYRASVRGLIESAMKFGRFDPHRGVVLGSGQVLPVTYHGFVWQPADFSTFLPVGSYASPRLSHHYAGPGVGAAYVVLTPYPARCTFTRPAQPFAATAVVAPSPSFGGGLALQFYDPLRTSTTELGLPIMRDLTAPIAYAASQETDAWLVDFLRPARGDPRDGLRMAEPFQPGKIPVVFVHGLASDPLTWAQLANDLRAQPAIVARYQFWSFRYDTGDPFLSSAAMLRRQLAEARQIYDPMRMDPSLSRIVLIGHSMGGLVSKMQVTHSGDILWNATATQPLETIVTDGATRSDLASAFFFAPSPDISRVVFIATPHQGSNDATRCIGRIGSALVQERADLVARHQQLVQDNPYAFRNELSGGVPTSIDLLEPQSCILQATNSLPYNPGVALHSIIGDDRWSLTQGRSDGVVAVSSARIGGVESELLVDASHTEVQRDSRTVREVICILTRHATLAP